MNWFDRDPLDLAGQSDPAQALVALRGLKVLTQAQMHTLDLCLHQWVMTVLLRPHDGEGIAEVQTLCGRAQRLAQRSDQAPGASYAARWKAWDDLLEGRRYALQAQAARQEPPAQLLHEEAILQRVAQGACPQSELVTLLGITAGRVSQLMGILEARGKIVRQRKGKESWVSLPAQPVQPAAPAQPAKPTPSGRGTAAYQLFGLRA